MQLDGGNQKTNEPNTNMENQLNDHASMIREQRSSTCGEWMTVMKPRRRTTRQPRPNVGEAKMAAPAKTADRIPEKEAGGKEGSKHNQWSRFSILSENQEELTKMPEVEIRSTNLGGSSQVNHKSNESMPQSKPGGARAKSKRDKTKGQDKVSVAASSEELLAHQVRGRLRMRDVEAWKQRGSFGGGASYEVCNKSYGPWAQ